jgi:hypothetical protein
MFRRLAALIAASLVLPASALAGGGNYAFDDAAPAERSAVRAALNASAFDWDVVQQQVTIHVGGYGTSHSTPGHIWLDRDLLASGRFAWATVMDEYAHQVDFFVLDPVRRAVLQRHLGGSAWCYETDFVGHAAQGCERLSSMVAWAYWPTRENSYRPESAADESAAMPAPQFRRLLGTLLGVPSSLTKRR